MNSFGISMNVRGEVGMDAKGEDLARRLAADALIARHVDEFNTLHDEQRKTLLRMASTLGLQPSANA